MHAATDRLEFAPPPTPGMMRAFGLAVLAHLFLLAALTWGVHWKREAVTVTAEAELWSATPQQPAPKLVEVPSEPPETQTPPPPVVKPAPKPIPPPPQVQPKLPDADIALEREKLRLKKEKQNEIEKQRLEKQRQETLKLKQEKLEQEKLKQEKVLEKKRLQDKRDLEKRDLDKKVTEDKKKAEQENKRKEALQAQQDAKKLEAQRQENIKRMTGLAGATGSPDSRGTALHSSGPSASYAGRVRASIKPNIVFVDEVVGNPTAEVEVGTAPDGTIVSHKLIKPSGNKSWDDAVLRAIDKTEKLPRDVDGRVPNSLVIVFRPKD